MMECETEQAKTFWEEMDVEKVFDEMLELLYYLRSVIRQNTATDREYVQAMKMVLEAELPVLTNEGIQEVLIDEDILTVTVSESQCSPESLRNGVETEDYLQKDCSRSVIFTRNTSIAVSHSSTTSFSTTDECKIVETCSAQEVTLFEPFLQHGGVQNLFSGFTTC